MLERKRFLKRKFANLRRQRYGNRRGVFSFELTAPPGHGSIPQFLLGDTSVRTALRSSARRKVSGLGRRSLAFVLRFLTLLVLVVLAGAAALAQSTGSATLVSDSRGAVVPDAQVVVINTETSFCSEASTRNDGSYNVPYLISD
jgi:hypothetical protein